MEKLILVLILFLPFIACNQNQTASEQDEPSKEELIAEIKELEARLLKALDAQKDMEAAKALIVKSEDYVKQFPKDSLAASYLFKAADVSRGIKDFGNAIKLWGQVWRNYEDYSKAPDALFLQGFTFDNDLQDKKMAKKYYEDFLQKYREHQYSGQVRQLLAVLGKSTEELIKEFQKQNQ